MKRKTKYKLLIVLVLGVFSLITYNYSFAKYVSNHAWNYYLGTKGFYFGSEHLGITKVVNVNSNWDFERTSFTLKNSENDFLVSDYDIEYTVKCTIQGEASEYSKCALNGTDKDTFDGVLSSNSMCKNTKDLEDVSSYTKEECETKGYEWIVQENFKEMYFDIVKTGEEDINYVSVLIEATTTSPYTKTLLGEFNLTSNDIKENGLSLDYMEYDNYSRVTVTNSYDEDKCVKLNWDADNLRLDNTSNETLLYGNDSNNNINEIRFNIKKKDSVSYVFYKTNFNIEYNSQEFSLIESNNC